MGGTGDEAGVVFKEELFVRIILTESNEIEHVEKFRHEIVGLCLLAQVYYHYKYDHLVFLLFSCTHHLNIIYLFILIEDVFVCKL